MGKPITKVDLIGFRGAAVTFDLDFDSDKDMTMLFGENGSGKSSILDAIDIVCNGGTGSLEDISLGQGPGQYLCTLGTPRTTLRATIHSGQESWTGTMQGNSVSTGGPDEKPRVKILRRCKVLALVTAQPRDRYDALKHFIDIGIVEQSERALQQKLRDVKSGINDSIATKERQITQLESVWDAEQRPGPGHTAMEWARDKVTKGISKLSVNLENLKQIEDAIATVVNAKNDYFSKDSIVADRRADISDVNQQIQDGPNLDTANALLLIESLSKTREYITVDLDIDKCPTCIRPIEREKLAAIVDEQLSRMTELKALSDRRLEVQRLLQRATDIALQAETDFLTALQRLNHVAGSSDIPEVADLNVLWPDWSAERHDSDALRKIGEEFEHIQLSIEQRHNDANQDVSQFNSVREWHSGIIKAKREAENLDRIRYGLQNAYNLIHEKRIAFTQQILDDIACEANRLYQQIHPNEGMDLTTLSMDETRHGSVHQVGRFHGHNDVPPQAVFSDSHLDTLGFCVWLALAKRQSPENTIILIDDIFSSVDASHLCRVIDLLSTEGQNFLQIIVATHFRLWWDRCQGAQGIQRVHLGTWTMSNGICAQNMPRITEQVRRLLAEPILERQIVSSKTGILLESILDDLALLFERSLPRNKLNQYTLGALLNACSKLFSKHGLTTQRNLTWKDDLKQDDWQVTDASGAFDSVCDLQFIRNQVGCHFNPPGQEIPDNEVRTFGQATIDLVDALTCPNCGYLATKVANEGAYLRCSCSKRAIRMTPVTVP